MKTRAFLGIVCAVALAFGHAVADEKSDKPGRDGKKKGGLGGPAAKAGTGKLNRVGAQSIPIGGKCAGCRNAAEASLKSGEIERCAEKGCRLYVAAKTGKPPVKGKCEACVRSKAGGKQDPCADCLKAAKEAVEKVSGRPVGDGQDLQKLFLDAFATEPAPGD